MMLAHVMVLAPVMMLPRVTPGVGSGVMSGSGVGGPGSGVGGSGGSGGPGGRPRSRGPRLLVFYILGLITHCLTWYSKDEFEMML